MIVRRVLLVLCLVLLPQSAFAVGASSDMAVTASDSPDPVAPDGDITYTIAVTNNGPSATTNAHLNVNLNGSLLYQSITQPAGWVCATPPLNSGAAFTCTAAALAVGTSNFTLVLRAPKTTFGITDQTISQNLNVNSANPDPNPGNDSINVTTAYVAPKADMGITASDSPDPVFPDGNITYTITVTNSGPDTATTAQMNVVLNNTLLYRSITAPAGWSCPNLPSGYGASFTCTAPTMASGAVATFTLVLNAGSGQFGVTDQTISEIFSATAAEFDPNHNNDNVTVTTAYVTPDADMSVAVTDAPDPVVPDGNITYSITVTNGGPDTATNAVLNVPLNNTLLFQSIARPAGWTCSTPAVGGGTSISCTNPSMAVGSASFTLVLQAARSRFGNTNQTINQFFGAGSGINDPNHANDGVTVSTAYVVPVANLAMTNSDTPDPVDSGANITYTQVLTSAGPDAAANTVVTENIGNGATFQSITAPAGFSCTTPAVNGTGIITCTNPSFASGANATFTVVVKVTATSGSITNTVSANSDASDPLLSNNSAQALTAVNPPLSADLSLTKTTASTVLLHNGTVTYTINLTNNGPNAASSVTMTDALPATLLFQSIAAPAGFTCTTPAINATGTITCSAATLANGATATFTLVAKVTANATGSITNQATAGSTTPDPTPGNSSGSAPAVPVSPGTAEEIPTLSEWALVALAGALAAVAAKKS